MSMMRDLSLLDLKSIDTLPDNKLDLPTSKSYDVPPTMSLLKVTSNLNLQFTEQALNVGDLLLQYQTLKATIIRLGRE